MSEADHPPLPAHVARQGGQVAVGRLLQVLQHRAEARVQRVDHLPLAEVAHPEQLSGPPVADERRRQRRGNGGTCVEVEERAAADRGLLAGDQVEPRRPGQVAVPVGADPHTGTVPG
nr:hypothetical protein OH820_23615 [Streptomyces sp. NBC_00857]